MKYTHFRPRLRSRHPSHKNLRPRYKKLPLFPFKSVIRLGSTTRMSDTESNGGDRVELNNIQSIKNSSNKLLMKQCFADNDVKTADWYRYVIEEDGIAYFYLQNNQTNNLALEDLPYPIISKNIHGSRGRGNKKHDNAESLSTWIESKSNLSSYIFEKYYNYVREYRLHVDKDGCFYTCRKMLRRDTPEQDRWYRNDDHCVWIMEDNDLFDRPVNWDQLVEESVKALNAVGLDMGAIDLRIQSSINGEGSTRTSPKFIIVEINSAPSFGEVTEKKYLEQIPKILNNKYNE